jgi:molybdopterin-guanine dinucleotide biosynthesis protein A
VSDRLLGVVLCGGQSTRMGRDKATLPHPDGGTFLQHAIDRIKQVTDEVVISGGNVELDDVPTIADSVAHQGPVQGIAKSVDHAKAHKFSACLVTPVDVPGLSVGDLCQLRDHWRSSGKLTIARSDRIEPLIGIYPVGFAEDLQQLARSTDRSLFRWIRTQDYTPLPFPALRVRNINTPEDLSEYGC